MSDATAKDRRRSFGAAAETYARMRPGYPDLLLDWVADGAARELRDVADVGAGTGALTQNLVARGWSVTALDPDPAMLAQLALRVPTASRVVSAAENLPVSDASYDAILSGDAWHWFDDEAAAREFARVVRFGGVVGLLWHVRDDRVDWMGRLTDAIGGDSGMRDEGAGERMAARIATVLPGVERRSEAMSVPMTPDEIVDLVTTYSTVILDPDIEGVRRRVRELLATHPDTAGRHRLPVPYVVRAYRWCPSGPTAHQPGGTA